MNTTTNYKPYPKYKTAGTDWLGRVPAEWEAKRLRYYFDYHAGGAWGEEENGNGNNMICFRVADFDFDHFGLSENDLTVRNIPENQHSRILEKGDILLEKSGGGEKQTVGRAVRFDRNVRAVCSNFIERLVPLKIHNSKYISYLMGALYFETINTRSIKQTTGIQNLDLYSYFCEVAPFPGNKIQQSIADFLDRETGKIDLVIEKKQKLVELLKEKRQALITNAVTKGLDPKAKMKSSGIDWLGDVPERWDLKRMNYLMRNIVNKAVGVKEGEFIIALENIESWTGELLLPEDQKRPEGDLKKFSKGDVLFGKLRPYLAKAMFAKQSGLCVGEMLVFRTNESLLNKFLIYRILTNEFINYVDGATQGAKMPRAEWEFIKTLEIAYPSVKEQQKIIEYIDLEIAKIKGVMKKIETQIEKLQEYRQALVSDAVTGKIKV